MAHRKMKVYIAALVTVLALVGGTAAPAQARGTCSDVGYLNYALRAAKQNLAGWKAMNRSAWSTAIINFKKARYNVSSGPYPCDTSYARHRRYATQQYDAAVRYAQAIRRNDFDDADYWEGEYDLASDLAAIWMS